MAKGLRGITAFDLRAFVRAAAPVLAGARLEKVYQPARSSLVLRLRGESRRDLWALVGRGVRLTSTLAEMPSEPSPFAARLRSLLGNARLRSLEQHEFDRVLELLFETADGRLRVVLELFGDGNVIVERDGIVAEVLVRGQWAHRELRPGAEFRHPPARTNPLVLSQDGLLAILAASKVDAIRALAVEANLGGPHAEELLLRAGVDKKQKAATLSADQVAAIDRALRAMIDELDAGEATLVVEDGRPVALSAVRLSALPPGATRLPVLEAFDRLFLQSDDDVPGKADASLTEERERLERQRARQEASLAELMAQERQAKEAGDAIYANYATLAARLEHARTAHREGGWEAVDAWAKSNGASSSPAEGLVRMEGLDIPLADGLDAAAGAYYERAKLARQKRERAAEAMARTELEMARLQREGERLERQALARRGKPAPSRRFWFDAYRWFLSSGGQLVLGGRDAGSNDKLVRKHLSEGDRFAHAEVHGAPSVVVKSGASADEGTLREACEFAAVHSKAWQAAVGHVDAYWVEPAQVSKTPNPGEHLARGAFVIRGKRNHVRATMRMAVGEVEVEGHRKVMGGPVTAVAARSRRFVVLEPGKESLNAFAARLASALAVPVEEVQAALPPGPVRVVEAVGLESFSAGGNAA
ncbi:MAG TPA: ribosome rescue protein RqcH [Candidatus Thermoplasmatota archaeon]|nr:ribosome rescue protein RqcH [Candidatus Thermoplasmatota archaeon]